MTEYIIVEAEENSLRETTRAKPLQEAVNAKVQQGYVPLGGVAVRAAGTSGAVYMQAMIRCEDAPPPLWQSVEQFEKSGYQGRCWILYKTRPVICTYTGKLYTFGSSNGVYMTECISGVIPLPTPSTEEGR